jgi:hypothetical protein
MSKKAQQKVKLLEGISLWLAEQGGDLAERKIKQALKDGSPEEKLADIFFRVVDEVVKRISDLDPNNAEQVKMALFDGIRDRIRPFLVELSQPALDSIKNADDQAIAEYVRDMLYDIIGVYTDSVEENKEQLKNLFNELRKSDRTKDVVLNNLVLNRLLERWKGTPREDYYHFLKGLLDEVWVLVQGDDEEAIDAAVSMIELKLQSIAA